MSHKLGLIRIFFQISKSFACERSVNKKLALNSSLTLFSNYIENPQNIDIDWTNELALKISKGFQAALTLNVLYDDDVMVQITDYDKPNGVAGLGKRVSLTQQFLLKYNLAF